MNKTILITGSTSGIGKEFVKIYAALNYNLVLTSTSKQELEKLKKELEEEYKNININIFAKDLSSEKASLELYEEIKNKKIVIDVLINNAGFGAFGKFTEVDIEKNTNLMMVNVMAVMKLSYYFGKEMAKRNNGQILNVASIASFASGPYLATYYASKACILSFTEALHEELKDSNISVTCLCPGPTATKFESTANLGKSYMFKKLKVSFPEDVAMDGYKALMKNKTIIVSGVSNKILVFLTRLTPRFLSRKLTKYINLGKIKK